MVIPDWTAPKATKIEFEASASHPYDVAMNSEGLARPIDRLAAAIVDVFVLLAPAYILLSAPFKRGMTASFILGSEPDLISVIAAMSALAVFLIVSYQSVLHYFFGATFGKMLFDLRVKPVYEQEKLTFVSCVARSLVWILEILTLGLPMLAIFSNARRRVIHDRICDTIVVAKSPAQAAVPASWERGLVRGFFGALVLFAIVFGSLQVKTLFDRLKGDHNLTALIDKDSNECEAVTRNLESDGGEHSRLEMAMSLYAAGLAERACLEVEVEREIATHTTTGPITYLAQAFVNSDDAEVSNSYLDQVCEEAPNTVECAMSKVVTKWSEEDWSSVERLLSSAKAGSGYLEVWAVRHYMKQGQYPKALSYLDTMIDHHELAEFTLVQRVKALFNSYSDSEANVALAQALPALSREEGDDLKSWMCAQQLQNGCEALQKMACANSAGVKDVSEIDFDQTAQALSKLMALECQTENKVDYLTFSQATQNEDWQMFFKGALKLQKDDPAAAFRLFSQVAQSPSAGEMLRVETLRRLTQFATSDQMANVIELWQGFDNREAWSKAGNILFKSLVATKKNQWALQVAQSLSKEEALSPQGTAELLNMDASAPSLRRPASTEDK